MSQRKSKRHGKAETVPLPARAHDVSPEPVDVEAPTKLISQQEHQRELLAGPGSALMAQQPTPDPQERIAVKRICPQCGTEFETDARFCPRDGASLRPVGGSDPYIGQTIGDRYHILSLVASGGMGRVYLAEHVRMNRQCAVKLMRQNLMNDVGAAARFAKEASNAARIIHPNVAAVFDYGETPDREVYLVMEFVDGEPLGEILMREKRMDPARVIGIITQVADGLAAAHELGIVHRDLKPDNIIVGQRSGREIAKVVDFGIAKAIGDQGHTGLTETGMVIGTPEFMSPEQLTGDPIDARSDIYALGCIAYLLLVGRPAFDSPTRDAMLKRRLRESPTGPRLVNAEVPAALDAIIVRMLAPSPEDRYQSAAEVSQDLARVQLDAPPPAIAAVSRARGRWSRRRVYPALALAVALVAVALVFHSSPPGGETAEATPVVDMSPVGVYAANGLDGAAPGTPAAGVGGPTTPPATTPPQTSEAGVQPRAPQAQPRASADEVAIRESVDRLAAAIRSRNAAQVRDALPPASQNEAAVWEQRVFRQADDILDVSRSVRNLSIDGGRATADVRIEVTFYPLGSRQETNARWNYRAAFERTGGAWRLVELVPRA